MRVSIMFALLTLLTSATFAQIIVTPKTIEHRRQTESEYKRIVKVVYPQIVVKGEPMQGKRIENTVSYWNVFETNLEQEKSDGWLSEMSYKVLYNKHGVLALELMRSGSGAYPSDYYRTVMVDRYGTKIRFSNAFKDRIGLFKKIDIAQAKEISETLSTDIEAKDLVSEEFTSAGKASDSIEDFYVSDAGVTFVFDYGFRHVIKALQPPGKFFFSWDEMKPHVRKYGPLWNFVSGEIKFKPAVPIVGLNIGGFIGGVEDGKFVAAKDITEQLRKGVTYVPLNMKSNAAGTTVNNYKNKEKKMLAKDQMDEVCPDFRSFEGNTRVSGIGIGAGATWDPIPRSIRSVSKSNRVYNGVVKNFLKARGINSKVIVDGIYRVDLDGDEVEEVVIAATNIGKNLYDAKVGDYSFVMVRKVTATGVKDILVRGDLIDKDADSRINYRYSLNAIADLNGDGVMELVVSGEYYEGGDVSVVGLDNLKPKTLIETGCGV